MKKNDADMLIYGSLQVYLFEKVFILWQDIESVDRAIKGLRCDLDMWRDTKAFFALKNMLSIFFILISFFISCSTSGDAVSLSVLSSFWEEGWHMAEIQMTLSHTYLHMYTSFLAPESFLSFWQDGKSHRSNLRKKYLWLLDSSEAHIGKANRKRRRIKRSICRWCNDQ